MNCTVIISLSQCAIHPVNDQYRAMLGIILKFYIIFKLKLLYLFPIIIETQIEILDEYFLFVFKSKSIKSQY